jgi:replication initiation and membrane attachment protein DnaB
VYTLRAEADRGRLTIYKVGKRYYTTPGDVKEMVKQCRVEQKVLDSTSIRREINSSSETERVSSALAAAQESALRLKNSSRNTLGKNIALPRRARP